MREFIAVAEYLNFSQAANHLFIAQSVLSRHIADLERMLGVQLFFRNKQKVQLTAMGQLFFQDAKEIIAKYEEAYRKLRLASCGIVGHLKLGFLERAVRSFLTDFILHFSKTLPHISLEFSCYDELEELTEAIKRNELDAGFTLSLGLENTEDLNCEPICQDNLCVIVRKDHPLVEKGGVSLVELAQEPFIMLNRQQNLTVFNHTIALCEARGFSPNIVKEAPNIDTALLMAELGTGILIAPRHHIANASSKLCFIDLEDEDCKIYIAVVWKQNNANPSLLPFIRELVNAHERFATETSRQS
nr:LysR family transcriptional regulator [Moorella sulfitireducens]